MSVLAFIASVATVSSDVLLSPARPRKHGFADSEEKNNLLPSHKDFAAPTSLDRRKDTTESSLRFNLNSISWLLYMETSFYLLFSSSILAYSSSFHDLILEVLVSFIVLFVSSTVLMVS